MDTDKVLTMIWFQYADDVPICAAAHGRRDGRTELQTIIDFIRPGDTLVVLKLDRLGRSTRDVLNLVHELEQKGAHLRVLEPAIARPAAPRVPAAAPAGVCSTGLAPASEDDGPVLRGGAYRLVRSSAGGDELPGEQLTLGRSGAQLRGSGEQLTSASEFLSRVFGVSRCARV